MNQYTSARFAGLLKIDSMMRFSICLWLCIFVRYTTCVAYLGMLVSALSFSSAGKKSLNGSNVSIFSVSLRALYHTYIVVMRPISKTRKNNLFKSFMALAAKKHVSTQTKTVTMAPTIQNGQCFT